MVKKILIVDDEPDIMKIIVLCLSQLGHEITMAVDGQQAVDLARQVRPDIILMDYRMPVLNGIEASKKIKEDAQLKHIPIIFMSASSAILEQELKNSVPADVFMNKPFDILELIEKVQSFIG